MSRVAVVSEKLGKLYADHVLIEYDGPRFFSAHDDAGQRYLALFVDEDDESETFLYSPLSEERLQAFLAGVITGRDAMRQSSPSAWAIKIDLDTAATTTSSIMASRIPDDWLPESGARVGVSRDEEATINAASKDLGDPDVLALTVHGLYELGSESTSLSVDLYHGNDMVWQNVVVSAPVLLERLGSAWSALSWQEGEALKSPPRPLEEVRRSLDRQLDESAATSRTKLTTDYDDFLSSHDLAHVFGADDTPSVVVFKEGLRGWVLTQTSARQSSLADVLSPLEELGDLVAGALDGESSTSQSAVAAWRERLVRPKAEVIQLVSRMSATEVDIVEKRLGRELWTPDEGDPSRSEILAAARMTTALSSDAIADVLSAIAKQSKSVTLRLDELSSTITDKFPGGGFAWEHGLEVAEWLRAELGISPTDRVDPEQLLSTLNVAISELSMPEYVDAIAAWGPSHGPAILLNSLLKSRKGRYRRRVTLAHELGHLLLDREGALPVADVLIGRGFGTVEARARAFAVELLLPQRVAFETIMSQQDNVKKSIRSLTKRYGVGLEIAAWQARNHGGLPQNVIVQLRSLVGRPWLFS